MPQVQPSLLTTSMISTLRAMAALYSQAKSDGKVDLFIDLACQTLWNGDPLYAPPKFPNDLRWRESTITERGKVRPFVLVPFLHTLTKVL